MRKVPTLFTRDPDDLCKVTRDVHPASGWVLDHPQYEGLVWHHPDGRMAKLKYRDVLASK